MSDTVGLVNPRGQPLVRDDTKINKARDIISPTPLFHSSATIANLHGATPNPRRHDYKLYLDMYRQHPLIKTAIDKKIMVATNTGYEFIPRSRRMKEIPEDQANVVTNFFDSQLDLINQLRAAFLDLEVIGDAFLYIVPDRRRRPKRLKHIAPWTMHIKAKKNGDVVAYVQAVGSETRVFKPHEIIHLRHINPDDDLYGMSRLEAIKTTVISDLYAENYNLNFFKNGAATGTMFVIKNATTQELEMNRLWIRDEYTSSENAHKPIILAGDVDVKKSVASHQDMGFLQGRDMNKNIILAALDVPPAKVGFMETANRSNSKEQDKSFRTEAVMPLQYIVEQGLSNFIRDVLGCPDVLFKFSEADIRDAQEQMDLWEKAAKTGFLTINEVRAVMGRAPIEGGDIAVIMTPTGAVPVADLELYFRLAADNLEQIPPEIRERKPGVDPAMYQIGPKPNPKDHDNAVVSEAPPTSKSYTGNVNVKQAIGMIDAAKSDNDVFRHCFTYVLDAADEMDHPLVHEAARAMTKARKYSDDAELRETYIERAAMYLKAVEGDLNG